MPNSNKTKTRSKNTILINGRMAYIGSANFNVMCMANSLRSMDYNFPNTYSNLGLNPSKSVLYLLGCEQSNETEDYSLLTEQTDEENIENPNIFDEESFAKIKNNKIKPDKSFPNENDPFYELDEEAPDFIKKSRTRNSLQRMPSMAPVVSSMAKRKIKKANYPLTKISGNNMLKKRKKGVKIRKTNNDVVRLSTGKYALMTGFKLSTK